jgi:transposase
MQAQRRRLSGKSTLSKAMKYALYRWDAWRATLTTAGLSIDNNLSERLLRGIAVTRKNFLFVGSDAGEKRASIINTIVETAKLGGLNLEAYIASVLNRLACGHPVTRIAELLPWNFRLKTPSTAIGGRLPVPSDGHDGLGTAIFRAGVFAQALHPLFYSN